MHQILILGAGKIGTLICNLLSMSGDYYVHLADIKPSGAEQALSSVNLKNVNYHTVDASNKKQLDSFIAAHDFNAVISGLPYYCNQLVVDMAEKYALNYFDLTEDVEVSRHVIALSKNLGKHNKPVAFVPQCGLAPGFISIIAQDLMKNFEQLVSVKMRVGALPVNQNNTLKYSLTWSTDGLINEYGNTCYGIKDNQLKELMPLEGYETITIDGIQYEAFNTSGGLGTLAQTYSGKINTMNYKTLRYPGHCEMAKLLMNDLMLNDDRETLKRILENAIPKTLQDVVVVYVSVSGYRSENLFEENYVNKIYPQEINGILWSAIQVTTAAGICGVVDIVMNEPDHYQGLIKQEDISLSLFLDNRFGQYYRHAGGKA
ncbi:saccharopine dehydrogenase NADP-binding domain-containing protein [Beggiatoa alba]|nr:saccharopine dehydrogenase NADP-binding domain-containing protein [Beggiatoa alba]